MSYVDDGLAVPVGATDDPARPPTGATDEMPAAKWNDAMGAVNDLLARALKRDGTNTDVLTPRTTSFTRMKLVSNDPDSRDNPTGTFIFENAGLPNHPMFCVGNPYVAGIGLEATGFWYTDDLLPDWKLIVSLERSGTFATVLDGVLRSAFESFHQNGDYKPWVVLRIKNRAWGSGHTVLITPNGADTIDGRSSITIPGDSSVNLISNGTNWEVQYSPPPP